MAIIAMASEQLAVIAGHGQCSCQAPEVTLVLSVQGLSALETCFPRKRCSVLISRQAIKGDLGESG